MIPHVSDIISKLRQDKRLTLDDFGSRIGYSGGYVGKLERGEMDITDSAIQRLSKNLNIPLYNLLVPHRAREPKPNLSALNGSELSFNQVEIGLQKGTYEIRAISPLYDIYYNCSNNKFDDLIELSVKSGISEERLKCITGSLYHTPGTPIITSEAALICNSLSKKFCELFAVVGQNIYDINTENVAYTLEKYVELHRAQTRNYSVFGDDITDDEVRFLEQQLFVYRKLQLRSNHSSAQ
ncbi:helix-turn-helix domain-containing protein [Cohnella soli]|uniref:Helix-turn-helix domain-containing protein n=1 Tax=Cohnella soli TaxID=425005 RepID=A0ABW0HME1_9BACL